MSSTCHWFERRQWIVLLAIIMLGMAKVVYISQNMNQRSDEDAHVTTGLEYLLYGTYTYERLHPPLARVFAALPTYLAGMHNQPEGAAYACPESFIEHYQRVKEHHSGGGFGLSCLHASRFNQLYEPADMKPWIKHSRIPIHVFYGVAVLGMFLLAREIFSPLVGLVAAFIYSVHVTLVEFASFVMTDVPMNAFMLLGLWAWVRWLKSPGLARMIFFSLLAALTILCKYSSLYYMPFFMIGLGLCYRFPKETIRHILAGGMVVFFTCWAFFGFSLERPANVMPPLHSEFAQEHIPESVRERRWLPLGEMVQGVFELALKNEKGHKNKDLHGHMPEDRPGRDLYYLIGYLLKSPLIALLPVLAFMPLLLLKPHWLDAEHKRRQVTMFSLLLLTFLLLLNSKIFLAMHHALPVFVFSTLLAASMLSHWLHQYKKAAIIIILCMAGSYGYLWVEYQQYHRIDTLQDHLYRWSYS